MQKVKFLKEELWYGGVVFHADKYPISENDEYSFNTSVNESCNQFNPIFLSNKGRFLWLEKGGIITFRNGVIESIIDGVRAGISA